MRRFWWIALVFGGALTVAITIGAVWFLARQARLDAMQAYIEETYAPQIESLETALRTMSADELLTSIDSDQPSRLEQSVEVPALHAVWCENEAGNFMCQLLRKRSIFETWSYDRPFWWSTKDGVSRTLIGGSLDNKRELLILWGRLESAPYWHQYKMVFDRTRLETELERSGWEESSK